MIFSTSRPSSPVSTGSSSPRTQFIAALISCGKRKCLQQFVGQASTSNSCPPGIYTAAEFKKLRLGRVVVVNRHENDREEHSRVQGEKGLLLLLDGKPFSQSHGSPTVS